MIANAKKPWLRPTLRRLPATDELVRLFAEPLDETPPKAVKLARF
jgi:hypothetical protein